MIRASSSKAGEVVIEVVEEEDRKFPSTATYCVHRHMCSLNVQSVSMFRVLCIQVLVLCSP